MGLGGHISDRIERRDTPASRSLLTTTHISDRIESLDELEFYATKYRVLHISDRIERDIPPAPGRTFP